jgi:hypothetical protein
VQTATLGLLNTLASFKDGKKYLLLKTDLIDKLSKLLTSLQVEPAI